MKKALITAVAVLMLLAIGIEPLLRSLRQDIQSSREDSASAEPGRRTRAVSCWFNDGWLQRSDCAWLYPRLQGEARTALPVVVLRAGLWSRSAAATVYLSGGPGGSSYLYEEAMPFWRDWMRRLRLDHDLVLFDPRGTGFAVPSLGCPEADEVYLHLLVDGASDAEIAERVQPLMQACAEQLPEGERREGLYSTRTAAQDLRELVRALREEFGYSEIRLYGASYGTRLAQVALAEPLPEVSRVVLDGFYPAGTDLLPRFADDFAAVLAGLDARCAQQPECAGPHAGLRRLLDAALERLGDAAVRVELPEPMSLPGFEETPVRALSLRASGLFAVLESEIVVGRSPLELRQLLEAARDGRFDQRWPEAVADWLWMQVDPSFSVLTQSLVECRDNPPYTRGLEAEMLARHPQWSRVLALPELAFEACAQLGVSPQPLAASVIEQPVLLLGAEFDTRTPTTVALEAARGFPQLSTLVLPITGHGLADIDDCAAVMAGLFLNAGEVPAAGSCR
jgi:pimeloyl-ACP methyl ester carboxylesterase